MRTSRVRGLSLLVSLVIAVAAHAQTAKTFAPPGRTEWRPEGCRIVPSTNPLLGSETAWRTLHADDVNSDEVSVALAPDFVADWVAEPDTWNPTGPVFDDAGNLYFSPLNPYEDVILISLDASTGARRWAVPRTTSAPVGAGAPLVLNDPDHAGAQIIYLGLYDRAVAVRNDGSIVWDVSTGLSGTPVQVFGVNYLPAADAIVGLAQDGFMYALDRRTGASILAAPYQLPGTVSPPGNPIAATPQILACAEAQLSMLTNLNGQPLTEIIDVLLGNNTKVANYFSIDPATSALWVAATAPDGEDGTVDGVSSFGALYRLDAVPNGALFDLVETCHRSFVGGSASTPALRRDGSRIYVGDNVGNLIAVDPSCGNPWTLPIGQQIFGAIAVSSDNGELYAATSAGLVQVIDAGATASIGWHASLDVFDLAPGQSAFNLQLASIGANGIYFQAGAGLVLPTTVLPVTTGVGLLDRETGAVRYFAEGLDESVAVMSTGPDGALYLGNSPLRRLFSYCALPPPVAAPIGGIRKYAPRRLDLLLRDGACAAADRARNARRQRHVCPASVDAERQQLTELVAQASAVSAAALVSGDLSSAEKARADRRLSRASDRLSAGRLPVGPLRSLCAYIERRRGGS